jgi:hypothetical protein
MRSLAIVAILAVSTPASAQLSAALGKPLPSPDLPVGTVAVRAIGTGVTDPLTDTEVTLVVDGKPRKAKTDASGRATFTGIPAGAKVKASVADAKGRKATSEEFPIPADTGVRVMIATSFVEHPMAMPSPREFSGEERPDDKIAAGTLVVRLSYNDLADAKPPAGVAVMVVGYATSGAVTFATHPSDARGEAKFDHLDPAAAYYAMTELTRNGQLDRLASAPIVLGNFGSRVFLSSDKRDSKAVPIDDLPKWDPQKDAIAADHVRVVMSGAADETSTLEVIAHATIKAPVDHVDIAVKSHAGQVLYVETTAKSVRYRSHPFQTLPRAGTTTTIYVVPPLLVSYQVIAQPNDPILDVSMRISVANYSWAPKPLGEVPLPKGFAKPEFDDARFKLTGSGVTVTELIAPGDQHFDVSFQLPATANRVAWSLDLPYGAWKSQVAIIKEPGVTLTGPAGTTVETKSAGNRDYLVISEIQIMPKQSLAMTIGVPTLPLLERTCRKLHPEASPMVGKQAPEITLPQLDGKPFKLSSLHGQVVVLNMTASWDGVARQEWPTFAKIGLPGVVPVVVFSDTKPDEVRPLVDATKSRVVLDAPPGDTNIGTVTLSWGTKLLPETYLIDRKGVVRYYIVNWRDWSSAEAKACLSALSR